MPRKPRLEFAGAAYHILARGDHGDAICRDDADRRRLWDCLAEVCGKTGWLVHAYVFMPNHYHLLVETPEANLVAGMRWLQGTYTHRYNHRHGLHGHLFQGRYKPLLIDPGDNAYFRQVGTYIHLNPVRAGLVAPDRQRLAQYEWSSYPAYLADKDRRPAWLHVDRVLGALDLADAPRDRESYAKYIADCGRQAVGDEADDNLQRQWEAIRRGWCLGSEGFRSNMVDRLGGLLQGVRRDSYVGPAVREHQRHSAEQLLADGLAAVGLTPDELPQLRKTDVRKQFVAWLLRKRTTVRNAWVAGVLHMGHEVNVSQAVGRIDAALSQRKGQPLDSSVSRLAATILPHVFPTAPSQ